MRSEPARRSSAGAACGWLAALADPIARSLGAIWPLPVGALLLALHLALAWPLLGRAARVILLLAPVALVPVLLASDPLAAAVAALRPAMFLVTFLAVFSLLRTVAGRSPLLAEAGRELLARPAGTRYAVLSLGAMLTSVVLLLGVLSLFGSMVMAGASGVDEERRRSLSAVVRGYVLMPAWSPISMPLAVVVSVYPAVSWPRTVLLTAPLCAVLWLLGLLMQRRPRGPDDRAPTTNHAWPWLVLLVLALVAGILVLAAVTGLRMIDAVLLFVPPVALAWLALLEPRRSATGWRILLRRASFEGSNEVAVFSGAAWLAGVLAAHVPSAEVARLVAAGHLPVWLLPGLVVALFVLAGQIAAPPVFAVLLVGALVPQPAQAGLPLELMAASCLCAWGLGAMLSPFNPVTLTLERLTGTSSAVIAHRWNGPYGLAAAAIVALALGVVAATG